MVATVGNKVFAVRKGYHEELLSKADFMKWG